MMPQITPAPTSQPVMPNLVKLPFDAYSFAAACDAVLAAPLHSQQPKGARDLAIEAPALSGIFAVFSAPASKDAAPKDGRENDCPLINLFAAMADVVPALSSNLVGDQSALSFDQRAVPNAQDVTLRVPPTHISSVAARSDPILNLNTDIWLNDLARDIVDASTAKDRISFRMMPDRLGRLDVEIGRNNSGLSIRLTTQSEEARAIVEAAQPQLVDNIRAQGIKLFDTQVTADGNPDRHRRAPPPPPTPATENATRPEPQTKASHSDRYA
jgi:flagellar hook-length control protein FliK